GVVGVAVAVLVDVVTAARGTLGGQAHLVAGVGAGRGVALGGGVAADAGLARARRPGVPALLGQDALGDDDLLLAAGLVGHRRELLAAEGTPGGRGELEAAVEAVTGVDVPPTAALALGELVPRRIGSCVGGRCDEQRGAGDGTCDSGAGEGPTGPARRSEERRVGTAGGAQQRS